LVPAQIELIDHAPQQVRVNLTAGSDQAGADFDDDSHYWIPILMAQLEWYRTQTPEKDFPVYTLHFSTEVART
jgi:hypothetical protein